jgi:hypothetical protein
MDIRKVNTKTFINETTQLTNLNETILENFLINYYDDVLVFLNAIFNTESTSILKIKITTFEINEEILTAYNEIIIKHKLKIPKFIIENFYFDDEPNKEELLNICLELCNNLLKKIDYSLKIHPTTKKIRITKI